MLIYKTRKNSTILFEFFEKSRLDKDIILCVKKNMCIF